MSDVDLRLTAAETAELSAKLEELVESYRRPASPATRP